MSIDLKIYGPWALVTGASSGIGAAFARTLARGGFNLVLVSRTKASLDGLGAELFEAHGSRCVVLPTDLSEPGFIGHLSAATAELDIGLLVSNAGAGDAGPFLETSPSQHADRLMLNVAAHVSLAHEFGRRLVARKRGGLVFVSSTGALQGVPLLAHYSACKAYLINFAEALSRELQPDGVRVTTVLPGPTDTPLLDAGGSFDRRKMPMAPMPAQRVVDEALAALSQNRPTHVVGRLNRMLSLVPRGLSVRVWSRLMASMMGGALPEGERVRALQEETR